MNKKQKRSKLVDKLRKEYIKEAKKADQRLVRLERLAKEEGYEDILRYAYRKAKTDISKYSDIEKGKVRYNKDIPTDIRKLRARLADVKEFLYETKTSTKIDIIASEYRRIDTFGEEYGVQFSSKLDKKRKQDPIPQIEIFFKRGLWDKLKTDYGSSTALRALGVVQAKKTTILKDLKQAQKEEKDLVIPDTSAVLNETINDMLSKYKKDLKKLGFVK